MMSKIFSKTVKKPTLLSVVIAIVVAVAIVICALFGFNKDATLRDAKSMTVSMNKFVYDTHKGEVKDYCENEFGKLNIKYVIEGEMNGDECELVFVFDKDVTAETLETKKTALQAHYDAKTADGGEWAGAFIDFTTANEVSSSLLAKHFVLRGVIAGVVFAVLAFAYASIRYRKLSVGLIVGGNSLLGMLLTAAVIIITRVCVTSSVAAIIGMAGLLSAAFVMFSFGKIFSADKEGSDEEWIVNSLAVKEVLLVAGGLAVAMLLVGILGRTAAAWFAVAAIIALIVSVFVALIYAPATCYSAMTIEAAKPVKDGYIGAKKTSTKVKKAPAAKVAAPAAPVEEAPVEESAEETPVEETPVEETPAEEPAEEAPVEE